jgi:hypothetical protein
LTSIEKSSRNLGVVGTRHINGEGSRARNATPVKGGTSIAARESAENDLRSRPPVGKRNFCCGGGAESSGNAGNNLEGHARLEQGFYFFSGASENERVAALQAHYDFAVMCGGDEKSVDFGLREEFLTAPLSDVDNFRVARSQAQHFPADQRVMKNYARAAQQTRSFYGKQIRIARTGPD